MFRLERYLAHVDAVFARVFGPDAALMPFLAGHPRAAAAVESLVVLALSYLAARLAVAPARPGSSPGIAPRPTARLPRRRARAAR